jgi:heme-degrading monooxygenase HmoA
MIARLWKGWTRASDTNEYVQYVLETGVKEYRETPGNLGAYILHRRDGDRTEFLTLSFWESLDSVRFFAGEQVDQAVFYPDDGRYLVDRAIPSLNDSPASRPRALSGEIPS